MPDKYPINFDRLDKQTVFTIMWIGVTLLFAALIILYDVVAASNSVFLTYSYNGGFYFTRAPWIVFAVVGVIAHMALQQNVQVYSLTGYSAVDIVLVTGVYAAIWHLGQFLDLWYIMRYWAMYVINFVIGPLLWSYIFALRPTY